METETHRVKIIAEIGSNYDNDLGTALEYVSTAARVGADAVKFQTLRRDKLVAPQIYPDGTPQENPVYRGFSNLELPDEWHQTLKEAAETAGIEFITTPFYLEIVDLLEDIGVSTYKIASGDITFRPLLEAVGRTGKPVILSTGAATLDEAGQALEVLERAGAGDVTLLHCVSCYPAVPEEMNLRALVTLRRTFGRPVGISDHSAGSYVAIAAVALGASVVEKHLTFDRNLPGPDHNYAMTPTEFGDMAADIRRLEVALGDGVKTPSPSEGQKLHRLRRGIYHPETLLPAESGEGIWLRPEHGFGDKR